MAVPSSRTDLSAVSAAANVPASSDSLVNYPIDSMLRAHGYFVALNYADILLKAPLASPTFTGTVALPSTWSIGGTTITATAAQINALANLDAGTLDHGTYSPTVSNESNGVKVSTYSHSWLRVGET